MKVIVYVEGPSDRLAMEELLAGLLVKLESTGITVNFIPTEGKRKLMLQAPTKAVNILRNDPQAVVIALPDLYPPNLGLPHSTADELVSGLRKEFIRILTEKQLSDDERIQGRFRAYCFKYDLEVLVLAAEQQLASRLGVGHLEVDWTKPVEDQNHHRPPKRIVEQLFEGCGDKYKDTIDAPLILGAARYSDIVEACPQWFKPFVEYLESLIN